MQKIESFLKSGFYIALVFLITLLAWSFYKETPPHIFNLYNMIGMMVIVVLNTAILLFYKNTLYTIPLVMSLLFIVNQYNISFDTLESFGFPFAAFFFLISGFIGHIIKYKVKFKSSRFLLGFFLIALSYLIPLLYTSFSVSGLSVSLVGSLYLFMYVFYANTSKGDLDYLFKVLLFANLVLTAEVGLYLYRGYMLNPELDLYHRLFSGWGRNLGWANINDMCFYIALTFPSYLYFIFKRPKTYLVWFLMILPTTVVILSKSRGGIIGYGVVIVASMLFFLFRGNKKHLTHGLVFLSIALTIAYLGRQVFHLWYEFFLNSMDEDLNAFSSGRIDIYKFGLQVFREYPLFGGSWMSIDRYPKGNMVGSRIFMYHSTFIQALAAMGLFGLSALLVHYYQISHFIFKNPTLEKYLFLIGYIASQAHGLIDNVQYAVPYSILIALILAIFETSEVQTRFENINHRFHYIEQT